MFEVRVETNFSSAHHLLNYKGKCENMHGHNWKVEVVARGCELDKSNILVDFKTLKKIVNENINVSNELKITNDIFTQIIKIKM